MLSITSGWLNNVQIFSSPHYSLRPNDVEVSLLVIHNISLPAGEFGGSYISDLFLGRLDCTKHPSFEDLQGVKVSAHCLIRRDGSIIQYVSFNDMAWHAGESSFQQRPHCNDYSIGIELEGADDIAYTNMQYRQLTALTRCLQCQFPGIILANIVGHCEIAPTRKTDPGQAFNWQYYRQCLHITEKEQPLL